MKVAIILFNLGGPDSLDAVQPFLRNLFGDPAILRLPSLIRRPLASLLARRRTPKARDIYAKIGGSSPILEVAAWTPDRIVCMPLYPQFSTTTTASSFKAWNDAATFKVPTKVVKEYPIEPGFVAASVELVKQGLLEAGAGPRRVLFSAHGLPERIVKAGDPYQTQIEQTAHAIAQRLDGVDWSVCYQSRVGPLKWIGPSTEAEIARAGADKVGVVLYPVSFVSEHSETLVELDIDYRRFAEIEGVPIYVRVPTVGTHPLFIAGLARLVRDAL